MQSYPCGFSWGSRRRVGALSFRWDFGGRGRSKLWGQCYSPVDSSMCAGPSTTGVGRIVPPRGFISKYNINIQTFGCQSVAMYRATCKSFSVILGLSSGQVNFSCPQLPPLSHSAENVSELRPQDIKVVMALGDSITAGKIQYQVTLTITAVLILLFFQYLGFGIMGLHNSWGEYRVGEYQTWLDQCSMFHFEEIHTFLHAGSFMVHRRGPRRSDSGHFPAILHT